MCWCTELADRLVENFNQISDDELRQKLEEFEASQASAQAEFYADAAKEDRLDP